MHTALPFRDLVLAVQSRPSPQVAAVDERRFSRDAAAAFNAATAALESAPPPVARLNVQCAGAGRYIDASALARPLLAAVLQTGWGVAPSSERWSAAHMRSVSNLLWSVGRTPFGPYSLRADLSFALRDAASRVPLHALASEIMREVRGLATYFGEFGKTVDDVLTASEHLRLCACLLYTSPSPRDRQKSRMPSSA